MQVFLQTGIRVSELASLTIEDIDFVKPAITVRGKGKVEREIALEKRGVQALKSYLAVRPESLSDILFLNYKGEPISERGIRKLVVKYRKNAGITKRASCHTLRHTFATYKAEKGLPVSAPAVVGTREFEHDTNLCAFGKAERQKDHGADKFMRDRYHTRYITDSQTTKSAPES